MLPELGTFPDCGGVLGVLLDDGENAGCDYSVGAAEVVIDFYTLLAKVDSNESEKDEPWRVSVMDCSSFSSSSVRVKFR